MIKADAVKRIFKQEVQQRVEELIIVSVLMCLIAGFSDLSFSVFGAEIKALCSVGS